MGRRHPPSLPPRVQGDGPALAKDLRTLWRYVQEEYAGDPARHGDTHMGGSDNLVTTTLPTTVARDNVAAIGSAAQGYATGGHVHELDLGELEELTGITFEDVDGLSLAGIHDPVASRLLSEILLEIFAMLAETR